jgi:hypothetical protein
VVIQVDSSVIDKLEYSNERLTIHFKAGTRYACDRFPNDVFSRWINAKSIGSFYNMFVKGKFEFYNVDEVNKAIK